MKRIFDSLRRWLIKKLGGYTEQRQMVQVVPWNSVPQHRFVEEMSVYVRTESELDYKRYCENQLLERLMQSINQSGLVLWESSEDIFRQEMNVRATVCVIRANDYGY